MKELSVELIEISFCGFLVRKYFYDLLPFHDFFDKALLRRERALLCDHVFGAVSAHSLDDGEHDDGTKPYDQSEPKAVPKHGTNTDSHSQTGGKERRKALSDELAREVTDLIDQAEQGEETTVSDAEDLPDKTIVLSTPNGDIYQLRNESGSFSLWRNTIDGDCHRRTLTFQDQRIETWLADAAAYVSVGRADDLYQLRTPYVGNNVAVANVVGSFQLNEVLGPYTIELQTNQEPYGIILHLEQDLSSGITERYLKEVSSLILALIDNAGYVAYTAPPEPTPQDTGASQKTQTPR